VNFYTSFYRGMGFENFLSWPNGGALHFIVRPEVAAERLAQYSWGTFRGGFWGPGKACWIAGAYNRGVRDFDAEAAYEALRRSATEPKRGWTQLADYMRLGYIKPTDYQRGRPDGSWAEPFDPTEAFGCTITL